MHLKLSLPYIVTFLLMVILMLELHEMAHIVTGFIICGCWGTRDFNIWALCEDCQVRHSFYWLATLAGPTFSFAIMWLGMWLLNSTKNRIKALGFLLIFSNIPLGRIVETMKGTGDEMTVARKLLANNFSPTQIVLICSTIVLALGLPPIIKAFSILTNKHSWLYLLGFLLLPILFILLYVLIGLNSLLHLGFLSSIAIMGTPIFITIHTAMVCLLFLLLRKMFFCLPAR